MNLLGRPLARDAAYGPHDGRWGAGQADPLALGLAVTRIACESIPRIRTQRDARPSKVVEVTQSRIWAVVYCPESLSKARTGSQARANKV